LFLSLCAAIVLAGGEAPSAAPAAATPPATAASGAGSYTVDPAKSWLGFTARQSGGDVDGRFDKFTAAITFADANLAASRFDVQIDTKSVNTQDDNRDTVLRGDDLFNSTKYPSAHFVTSAFTRKAAGQYEATGKLTIRDVTREIHLPFTFQTTQEGGKPVAWLKGSVGINRLDYGVGQGEWKDTSVAENPVRVKFELRLSPK
ncbi:MAG TPA: YceI family protein, partial [Steroidobacteraceae bacterium]|nr:YceI family protein [Steroidobacteraceae bacterium]